MALDTLRIMEMSKVIIGGMRFKDRRSGVATVRAAIDAGFNYIDTSPCYCRKDEEENSESWVGEAVNYSDYRERVMVSTKCSAGDGGRGLGEFQPAGGFSVRTAAQLDEVFAQSLKRLNLKKLDYYHLWTTHTPEQFNEAMKPGGWYDGVMNHKGQWDHLGITTHADAETVISFLETGKFETVTMPLNVTNTTRLKVVEYCAGKDIKVIAMNPLAGGFLAGNEELKELALRYLMLLPNVHPLIGFTSIEEVEYAKWIEESMSSYRLGAGEIMKRVNELMNTTDPRCTACGYCQPCPEGINVGESLAFYNAYKYLGLEQAKKAFIEKQWDANLNLNKCIECGKCEQKCPNNLPVRDIIKDAQKILYKQ